MRGTVARGDQTAANTHLDGQRTPGRDRARRVAYTVLRAVAQRDSYANLLLPRVLTEQGLSGRDAALATELTYGTLRNQGTYDAILDTCVDRSLRSVDDEVLPLLRLGAHQLLAMAVPAHIAVSATVNVARRIVGQQRARFVNAVLRRVGARDREAWLAILAPDHSRDPVAGLALRHSHPEWIVSALAEALGEQTDTPTDLTETRHLLTAHNERPLVSLLAKPGRATVSELVAEGAHPGRYSPYAAELNEGDPARMELVRQGHAAVQDEASQLVALALGRVPLHGRDQRWLDVCSGPGGKAALLANLAGQSSARLLAAEVRPGRAGLVAEALRGTVADAGRVVVADGTRPPWQAGAFDRVLVDAPCTGLGALRRRPEARWRRAPESLADLVPLQIDLLDQAVAAARPGGVVAYVTCSPHRAETTEVVAAVEARRGDIERLPAVDHILSVVSHTPPSEDEPTHHAVQPRHTEQAQALTGLAAGSHGEFAQFWPHRHGTDAIFLALLRRRE
ncbi:transcription antitermination factor NusB [Lipingzhangella sp. LS1_29]|uniref:Transcription antitermination factor NusB n=1 Tax=Lipingzhangella rawalii TaxID=2055835 RepID=A0ABU2H2D8_9ACTN|nr:transcription antitermination factor NusB [Lipingzhangella rawalii]MDS1269452.1 transcription antitermination factor NusB [Lipingzhangella rawalii]